MRQQNPIDWKNMWMIAHQPMQMLKWNEYMSTMSLVYACLQRHWELLKEQKLGTVFDNLLFKSGT